MNGNAVWLTCRECGHTSRVLALMAGRVLKTRTQCPGCASTAIPCLNSTPTGSGIALSDEQSAALREMNDPALHALLVEQELHTSPMHWIKTLQSRMVGRFSGRKQYGTTVEPQQAGFHPAPGTITPTGTALRL